MKVQETWPKLASEVTTCWRALLWRSLYLKICDIFSTSWLVTSNKDDYLTISLQVHLTKLICDPRLKRNAWDVASELAVQYNRQYGGIWSKEIFERHQNSQSIVVWTEFGLVSKLSLFQWKLWYLTSIFALCVEPIVDRSSADDRAFTVPFWRKWWSLQHSLHMSLPHD